MAENLESEIAVLALTERAMEQAIVEWAGEWLRNGPGRRAGDGGLRTRMWEALRTVAKARLGRVHLNRLTLCLEQLRPEPSDRRPSWTSADLRTAPPEQCVLDRALGVLCSRFLCCHGGDTALTYEHLLDAQFVLRRIEVNQLVTYSWTPGRHHQEPWPSSLTSEELRRRARGPALPVVALPVARELGQEGLVEVHRHMNISTLSLLLWTRYVIEEETSSADLDERQVSLADRERLRWAALLRRALMRIAARPRGDRPSDLLPLTRLIAGRGQLATRLMSALPPMIGRLVSAAPGGLLGLGLRPFAANGPVSERELLYRLFDQLRDPRLPPVYRAAIHLYCLLQNWFAQVVQQPVEGAKGLDRFVEDYAQNGLRDGADQEGPERLRQAYDSGGVHFLEARLSPSRNVRGKAQALVDSARDRGLSRVQRLLGVARTRRVAPPIDGGRGRGTAALVMRPDPSRSMPGVGLIFTFVKRKRPAEPALSTATGRTLEVRHGAERWEGWSQAEVVMQLAQDPELAPLLLAMDICGTETGPGIEVFAPHVRYLRYRCQHSTGLESRSALSCWIGTAVSRPTHLPLTVHAGEDFDHLLCGLRHIDEAITFCGLERGDRVGHGVALGADVGLWARLAAGETRVRAGDWLDDLAWFHGWLSRLSGHGVVRSEVERQLASCSSRVYGRALTAAELQAGWDWRSQDPLVAQDSGLLWAALSRGGRGLSARQREGGEAVRRRLRAIEELDVLPFRKFAARSLIDRLEERQALVALRTNDGEGQGLRLWAEFLLDERVRRTSDEVITVSISEPWYPALTEVQDLLAEELVKRCIVVEINPSSNLTIGPFENMTQHPVFRWLDPQAASPAGSRSPFVVVGTDDPAVFATELSHEYAALARAAELRGANPTQIRDWLFRLRENGFSFSFFPKDLPQ